MCKYNERDTTEDDDNYKRDEKFWRSIGHKAALIDKLLTIADDAKDELLPFLLEIKRTLPAFDEGDDKMDDEMVAIHKNYLKTYDLLTKFRKELNWLKREIEWD